MPTKREVLEMQDKLRSRLKNYGATWIPENNRLYGVPGILPGEVFSSWCWRIAVHLGKHIETVLKIWGIAVPSFWLDFGIVKLDLKRLAASTMFSMENFEDFRRLQSTALSYPEFACLTTEPLNQLPIYRYCEQCLSTDPKPYIRYEWRISTNYICMKHGTILRERCPHCQARIDLSRFKKYAFYKMKKDTFSIRLCQQCGADLCSTKSAYLPDRLFPNVLLFQEEMLSCLFGKQNPLCDEWGHPEFFEEINKSQLTKEQMWSYFQLPAFTNLLQTLHHLSLKNAAATVTPNKLIISRSLKILISAKIQNGPTYIFYAIDGRRIFKNKSGLIASYIMECQDLLGSTSWLPENCYTFGVKNILPTSRHAPAAFKWIKDHGKSKKSYKPFYL